MVFVYLFFFFSCYESMAEAGDGNFQESKCLCWFLFCVCVVVVLSLCVKCIGAMVCMVCFFLCLVYKSPVQFYLGKGFDGDGGGGGGGAGRQIGC